MKCKILTKFDQVLPCKVTVFTSIDISGTSIHGRIRRTSSVSQKTESQQDVIRLDLEAGTAQLVSGEVVDNNTVRIVSGMGACVAVATSSQSIAASRLAGTREYRIRFANLRWLYFSPGFMLKFNHGNNYFNT